MNKFDKFLESDKEYWSIYDKVLCYDTNNKYKNGLREYSEENFGLNKCLEKLFPEHNFIHDKYIKIDGDYIYNEYGQKIRPDYVCEELKLIIEFDGESWNGGGHYTDPFVINKDISNTKTLLLCGYKVIRIPFYIQLDRDMIKYYFNIDYNGDPLYDMWEDHGFIFPTIKLPSYFCESGLKKFINDLTSLPKNVTEKILFSIGYRMLYYDSIGNKLYADVVIPRSIHDNFKYIYGIQHIGFNPFPENMVEKCMYIPLNLPMVNEDMGECIDSHDIDGKTYLTLSKNIYLFL